MSSAVLNGFHEWIRARTARRPLVLFRIIFAAVWLTYDLIDVSMGETFKQIWFLRAPVEPRWIIDAQVVLIVCEVGLLLGWRARWFAFAAFLARSVESWFYPLNDFLYYSVTALILSLCDCEKAPLNAPEALAWPRDLLVLQTAWIYSASAIFKLNPDFLSGGDLFVRQNYTASILPIPYPGWYLELISHLEVSRALAWLGVGGELMLGVLLFLWWWWPERRRFSRVPVWVLAASIHGCALFTLNVFFFSVSMLAQVFFIAS